MACREKRVNIQTKLLQAYRCPLISFTMNIAESVKTSPLIRRAFYLGVQLLEDTLPSTSILYKKRRSHPHSWWIKTTREATLTWI